MSQKIELKAADGHRFETYVATPKGDAIGVVVIAPEIFGVNTHIRSVADQYAADGFLTLAPALFDRSEPGYEAGYDDTAVAAGRAIIGEMDMDASLRDIQACIDHGSQHGSVGLVGYCWGGTIAWLAAARLPDLNCSAAYYAGGIGNYSDETPQCPTMLHFGEQDTHPTLAVAKQVAADHPKAQSFFYPAGHGFNCDQRGSYHAESAQTARERTLELFRQQLTV